jgi:hypothetical protein
VCVFELHNILTTVCMCDELTQQHANDACTFANGLVPPIPDPSVNYFDMYMWPFGEIKVFRWCM